MLWIQGSTVKPKVTNDTIMYYSKLPTTYLVLYWYFYLTNHGNTSDTMLDEYLKITAKKTGRPRT